MGPRAVIAKALHSEDEVYGKAYSFELIMRTLQVQRILKPIWIRWSVLLSDLGFLININIP